MRVSVSVSVPVQGVGIGIVPRYRYRYRYRYRSKIEVSVSAEDVGISNNLTILSYLRKSVLTFFLLNPTLFFVRLMKIEGAESANVQNMHTFQMKVGRDPWFLPVTPQIEGATRQI